MEREISSGASLGVVLLALAAIIGIGFGVFAIAKSTANTGVNNTQEQLNNVNDSAYSDYDQQVVTGQQVKTCYDQFEGKPTVILIATQATKDHTNGAKLDATVSGIKEKYGTESGSTSNWKVPYVTVTSGAPKGDSDSKDMDWKTSKNEDINEEIFINYNALLANEKGGMATQNGDEASSKGTPYVYFKNNCYLADWGLYTLDGRVRYNNITGNLSKTGMTEFLPTSARFQAYLIKDTTGSILGAAFDQIVSN